MTLEIRKIVKKGDEVPTGSPLKPPPKPKKVIKVKATKSKDKAKGKAKKKPRVKLQFQAIGTLNGTLKRAESGYELTATVNGIERTYKVSAIAEFLSNRFLHDGGLPEGEHLWSFYPQGASFTGPNDRIKVCAVGESEGRTHSDFTIRGVVVRLKDDIAEVEIRPKRKKLQERHKFFVEVNVNGIDEKISVLQAWIFHCRFDGESLAATSGEKQT